MRSNPWFWRKIQVPNYSLLLFWAPLWFSNTCFLKENVLKFGQHNKTWHQHHPSIVFFFYKVSWKFRVSLPTSRSKASDLHHFLGMAKQHTFGRWNLAYPQHVSRVRGVEKMLKNGDMDKLLLLVLQCKLKVLQEWHIDLRKSWVLKVYKGCRISKKSTIPEKYDWSGSKFPRSSWKFPSRNLAISTDGILKVFLETMFRSLKLYNSQRTVISYQFPHIIWNPSKLEGLKNHPKNTECYLKFTSNLSISHLRGWKSLCLAKLLAVMATLKVFFALRTNVSSRKKRGGYRV